MRFVGYPLVVLNTLFAMNTGRYKMSYLQRGVVFDEYEMKMDPGAG